MLIALGATSWAVGISVAVFTLFSGLFSLLLLLINFLNGQPYNYVSILAVVIALDKFNNFAMQVFTLFNFHELMVKTFDMVSYFFQCKGAKGLPLFTTPDEVVSAMLSIQLFLINAQGFLFFYWSLVLFASSWSLSPVWWKNKKIINATKISCFVVPGIQLALLQIPVVRDNDFAVMMIMNVLIIIDIGMGSVFLVLTLLHVINVHLDARGTRVVRLSKTYDGVVEFHARSDTNATEKSLKTRSGIMKFGGSGKSDAWLIARIVLAFIMVEGLTVYVILMQIFYLQRWAHFKAEWRQGLSEPDIDEAEQFANLCSPIPGSLTGYLFFLVFGTTLDSRLQLRRVFRAIFCCGRRGEGYNDLPDRDRPSVNRYSYFKSTFAIPPSSRVLSDAYLDPMRGADLSDSGRSTISPTTIATTIATTVSAQQYSPALETLHTPVTDNSFSTNSSPIVSMRERPLMANVAAFDFGFRAWPPTAQLGSPLSVELSPSLARRYSIHRSLSSRESYTSSEVLASPIRMYTPLRPNHDSHVVGEIVEIVPSSYRRYSAPVLGEGTMGKAI